MRTLPILPVVLLGFALSWTAGTQAAPSKEFKKAELPGFTRYTLAA